MKKTLICMLAILLFASFKNQEGQKVFKKLYALEGMWLMQTKKGFVGEEWVKVNKDLLAGKGFYIKGVDTVNTENILLRNSKDGIFYVPAVEDQNNKQPIIFKMTESHNNAYVFENSQHDFPKRIVYKLVTPDSIHAFVDDGTDTGKRQNFYYKRWKK